MTDKTNVAIMSAMLEDHVASETTHCWKVTVPEAERQKFDDIVAQAYVWGSGRYTVEVCDWEDPLNNEPFSPVEATVDEFVEAVEKAFAPKRDPALSLEFLNAQLASLVEARELTLKSLGDTDETIRLMRGWIASAASTDTTAKPVADFYVAMDRLSRLAEEPVDKRIPEAMAAHREAIRLLTACLPPGVAIPIEVAEGCSLVVDSRGLVLRPVEDQRDFEEGTETVLAGLDLESLHDPTLCHDLLEGRHELHWASRVQGLQLARLVVATYELAELVAQLHEMETDVLTGSNFIQVQGELQRVVRAMQPLAEGLEKLEPLTVDYDGGEATLLVTRHGLSVLAKLPPEDEVDVIHTTTLYAMPLAVGLLGLVDRVGTAMIETGEEPDGGEVLLNALQPWVAHVTKANAAPVEGGHKWIAERTGADMYRDDEERRPDALTIWRCTECGCRAVGFTVEGPAEAKYECYWIAGKPVEREPYEFLELHGDEPVDGTKPPPMTCAEVMARDAKAAE